ncbi:MAG: helix-turn-helix domain-containing protein [Ruminococcus sp.]|nr:helix-turn-helix domain-containing protein [Ruminococcus sp.]
MSIINNLLSILEKKELTQTDLCNAINVNTSTVTNWKTRNTDPPSRYIIPICEFLGVTPEYLLTGTERSNNANISNSTVEAVGTYSKGTVTLGGTVEPKHEIDVVSECILSENEEELLRIFKSLPKRERVKLLNMVYEFEEDYRHQEK